MRIFSLILILLLLVTPGGASENVAKNEYDPSWGRGTVLYNPSDVNAILGFLKEFSGTEPSRRERWLREQEAMLTVLVASFVVNFTEPGTLDDPMVDGGDLREAFVRGISPSLAKASVEGKEDVAQAFIDSLCTAVVDSVSMLIAEDRPSGDWRYSTGEYLGVLFPFQSDAVRE